PPAASAPPPPPAPWRGRRARAGRATSRRARAALSRFRSRINPPRLERSRHLADTGHERSVAKSDAVALGELPDPVEGVAELVREAAADLVAVPEEPA